MAELYRAHSFAIHFCGMLTAAAIIIPACDGGPQAPTEPFAPPLSVVKTGVVNGNVITYTIKVTNTADTAYSGASVADALQSAPPGTVLTPVAPCTSSSFGGTALVSCTAPGQLGPGQSVQFTVTATVPLGVTGEVVNCATVGTNLSSCVGHSVIAPPSGSLTIVKDAQPDGPDDFGFTTNSTLIPSFMLDDDADATLPNQRVFSGLPVGSYTVSETPSAEWELASITCVPATAGVINPATRSVAITVTANQNVTCTFANKQLPPPTGTLTIVKHASVQSGQDFSFTSSNPAISAFQLDVDADATLPSQRTFVVPAGTYAITEAATAGWALADIVCTPSGSGTPNLGAGTVSVGLGGGAVVTCTFSNTKQPALITSISPAVPIGSASAQAITISGANFDTGLRVTLKNETTGETAIDCPPGPPDCFMSSLSSSRIVLNATFGVRASNQVWSLQLTNPGMTPGTPTQFTVQAPAPTVNPINDPPTIRAGTPTVFTISGTNFSVTEARVLITGPGCGPCVVDNSTLTVKTNTMLSGPITYPSAGEYTLKVQNAVAGAGGVTGPESNGITVTVQSAPPAVITSITPTSPTGSATGTVLTITGRDFQSGMRVVLRNVTTSETAIDCPPGPPDCFMSSFTSTGFLLTATFGVRATDQTWSLELINPGTTSSGPTQFTVIAPTPGITAVTTTPTPPTAGSATVFTISGSNFSSNEARVSVTGPGCEPCVIPNGSLTTKTSSTLSGPITFPNAGTYTFRVQNAVQAGAGGFTGPQSNTATVTVAGGGGAGGLYELLTPDR